MFGFEKSQTSKKMGVLTRAAKPFYPHGGVRCIGRRLQPVCIKRARECLDKSARRGPGVYWHTPEILPIDYMGSRTAGVSEIGKMLLGCEIVASVFRFSDV